LKRLAEIFAVLVFTAGLMAGGAALYSWLRPQAVDEFQSGSTQVTGPTDTLVPVLTEGIVFALIEDFLETPPQDSLSQSALDQRNGIALCFQKGAKGLRYKAGVWTVQLAGIGCNGLEIITVDDLTGQVISLSPTLTASTIFTLAPVFPTSAAGPTPPPEPTPTPGPSPTPGATPLPRPTPNPQHARLVGLIEQYLSKSGQLNASCITTAAIEAKKGFIPSAATTGIYWSVRAENDYEAQTTWSCPQLHYYEVDDFTGEVRRTREK
jgi:hypothetical protein